MAWLSAKQKCTSLYNSKAPKQSFLKFKNDFYAMSHYVWQDDIKFTKQINYNNHSLF